MIAPGVEATSSNAAGVGGDVLALPLDLVRALAEDAVEDLQRDGHEIGVRDPGAVEALTRLALLVLAHLRQATAFTSGSRRDGMKAAMPPIACAPRRWHVFTSSSV